MIKLLALDQASNVSGWAVFEDGKLLESGTFTAKGKDLGERLYDIRQKVSNLISKYNINYLIFEDIQLQGNVTGNVQTFKALAEVFGIIYELATELNIPNEAVLASSWKSTLGIKGRQRAEQKRNAQKYVLENYGKKVSQDESDSICIGTHYFLKQQKVFDWSD